MQGAVVGNEVAIQSGFADHGYSFGWKIIRVTPKSGKVVVEGKTHQGERWERQFDKFGYEIEKFGSGRYRARLELSVDNAKLRTLIKERTREAADALFAVKSHDNVRRWMDKISFLEEVERLEKLLAEARAKVEAI